MIDGDRAKLITMDATNGVPPNESKLVYTREDILFYQKVQQEIKTIRVKDARAIIHTPE